MEAAYYRELIRPLVAGRRVVLCGQLLNGSTALVETLRALGTERCLVLAHGIGTGRPPSPEDADQVVVETRAARLDTRNPLRTGPQQRLKNSAKP